MTPFPGSTPPLCARIDDFVLMPCAQLDNRFDISHGSEEGTYSFGPGPAGLPSRFVDLCDFNLAPGMALSGNGPHGRATRRHIAFQPRFRVPAGTCPQTFADTPNSFHEKADDALPISAAGAATHAAIDLLAPQRQRRLRHLHAPVLSYVRRSNRQQATHHRKPTRCPWLQAANAINHSFK